MELKCRTRQSWMLLREYKDMDPFLKIMIAMSIFYPGAVAYVKLR